MLQENLISSLLSEVLSYDIFWLEMSGHMAKKGKTVKIRCGPAAVTGDERRMIATVLMDGKARQLG